MAFCVDFMHYRFTNQESFSGTCGTQAVVDQLVTLKERLSVSVMDAKALFNIREG